MDLIAKYLQDIENNLKRGNATEHTHRPALKKFIESVSPKHTATNEPTREACGAPDYSVTTDSRHGLVTTGYIEAKDVGTDLDEIEHSEQLDRYRSGLHNLVLTDYLEFRWYVGGKPRGSARLGSISKRGQLVEVSGGAAEVRALMDAFLLQSPEPVTSPRDLAQRLAKLTHLIRDVIVNAFASGKASRILIDLRRAFAETLLPEIDQPGKTGEFADMYAQTLAYGLFAARCNHHGGTPFVRQIAAEEIPKTNPFLRQLFDMITGPDMNDEPYAGLVDDLVALLDRTDMSEVLADFGARAARHDPVVHFYETFLAAYDPKLRELRGVYYTPEPVVSYIVRSVDWILREKFSVTGGLADPSLIEYQVDTDRGVAHSEQPRQAPRVLILDPACGTGTFLYSVVDHIRDQFVQSNNAGKWSPYVRQHLLPRLLGFELLMAPYAVAHLKLGMQLAAQDMPEEARTKWGYDFATGDRLAVYLTNTLEEAERKVESLFGPFRVISEEANAASRIKRELPIMVVMGNPPYSGHSANKGKWIRTLIEAYKEGCPELYKPAQAKWLSDDYVKFIRFAQWRIERTGSGVLAFVTNHSYLDNPTFRGMRRSLLQTFDEVYILDLHGNAKKKETTPDGSNDKNVFDIQQGVAISLWVRSGLSVRVPGTLACARHADLFGERQDKYDRLSGDDVSSTKWVNLSPAEPQFLLVPQDSALEAEYGRFLSIRDIFSPNGNPAPGIVTTHDDLAISWTPEEAAKKVEVLLATKTEAEAREHFTLCTQNQWQYERAKRELADGRWRSMIVPILYRPFDRRFTVYDRNVAVHRRERVSSHMLRVGANIALIAPRQAKSDWGVMCTRTVAGHKTCTAYDVNYVFPLFLEDPLRRARVDFTSREERDGDHRSVNLSDRTQDLAWSATGNTVRRSSPLSEAEAVRCFAYMYALLNSPTYRKRYCELLRKEFARLPITATPELYRSLSELGHQLLEAHLLEGEIARRSDVPFPIKGSDEVQKGYPKYVAPGLPEAGSGASPTAGRVYINRNDKRGGGQYFDNVSPEIWEHHIGGYQVCEKWLKDRRLEEYRRQLTFEDIEHYQRIVAAVRETIRIQKEIDAAIGAYGGWPGAFDGESAGQRAVMPVRKTAEPRLRYDPSDRRRKR